MQLIIGQSGQGFAKGKILEKKREAGPIFLTMRNILKKFSIHIDVDKF